MCLENLVGILALIAALSSNFSACYLNFKQQAHEQGANMSVRKIINKGNRKVIGRFPSLKLKRNVWWESQLERDYIYILEFA